MTEKFRRVFGTAKPVIAMVHFGALPGSPLYDPKAGVEGLIDGVSKDLKALQDAGFDAVMFGNENDRPYEFDVDAASTATMAYVIGRVRETMKIPFGVNVLWDPMSSIALAAATGASFVREIFTGTYASDMGPWTPDAGKAMRYRDRLHRSDLAMLYNVSAEFAHSLDQRSLPDRARSAVFSGRSTSNWSQTVFRHRFRWSSRQVRRRWFSCVRAKTSWWRYFASVTISSRATPSISGRGRTGFTFFMPRPDNGFRPLQIIGDEGEKSC